MVPAIWNYLVGLRRRHRDRGDRPLHRLRDPRLPPLPHARPVRARARGASASHYKWIDLLSLGWVALITILFIFPLYKAGLPWETDFTWELTNYTVLWFAAHRPRLRRLVVPLGEELVQGTRAPGHRGGARADRGGARRRTELPPQPASSPEQTGTGEERLARSSPIRSARSRTSAHPIQAPPFWSIVWPVTPRASGESSQATVPAMSSGWPIRPSGTSRIASAYAPSRVSCRSPPRSRRSPATPCRCRPSPGRSRSPARRRARARRRASARDRAGRPSRRCSPCTRARRCAPGSTRSRRRAGAQGRPRGGGAAARCTSRCRTGSSARCRRSGRPGPSVVGAADAAVGDEPVDRPQRGGRRGDGGVDARRGRGCRKVRVAADLVRDLLEPSRSARAAKRRALGSPAARRSPCRSRLRRR